MLRRIGVRACRRVGERENPGAEGNARLLEVGELRRIGTYTTYGTNRTYGLRRLLPQVAPAASYKSHRSYKSHSPQVTGRRVIGRRCSPLG